MTTDKENVSFQDIYIRACQNALTHGMGIIAIRNGTDGMEVSSVAPSQFVELAHGLLWIEMQRVKPDAAKKDTPTKPE